MRCHCASDPSSAGGASCMHERHFFGSSGVGAKPPKKPQKRRKRKRKGEGKRREEKGGRGSQTSLLPQAHLGFTVSIGRESTKQCAEQSYDWGVNQATPQCPRVSPRVSDFVRAFWNTIRSRKGYSPISQPRRLWFESLSPSALAAVSRR